MRLKIMLIVLLSGMLTKHSLGAEPGIPATQPLSKVSPEAADARTKYDTTIRQLREDFLAKVSAEHLKYVKRLDTLMSEATKRGNLEAAISIRYELANEKEKTPARIADGVGPPETAAPNATPTLSGTYLVRWSFAPQSTIRYVFKNGSVLESTANMSAPFVQRDGFIAVAWPNGFTDRFCVVGNILFGESRKAGVRAEEPPTGFGRGEAISAD